MPTTLTKTPGETQLRIELNDPQLAAVNMMKPGTSGCLAWGRGVGKSYLIRQADYMLVTQYDGKPRPNTSRRGVRIILLMPTLAQARKVHEGDMIAELTNDWAALQPKIDRSTWKVTFPGGSEIQWVTAERAKNTRGIRCDKVNIDEADDVGVDIYDGIVQPWLSAEWSLGISVVAGTPTRGRNGLLYRQFKRGKERFRRHWFSHATGYDVRQVSRRAIDDARAGAEHDGRLDVFKREWLCDFDSAEGLVYPGFHEDFHIREPHPDTVWTDILVGVDHGFAAPGAFVLVGVQGKGDNAICHVLDEVYKTEWTTNDWLAKASEWHSWYPNALWFGDPAWPHRIEEIRRIGARIVGADNAVEDGIAEVAKRLQVNEASEDGETIEYARLYVHPRCVNTIKEFGSYRRKRDPKNRDRSLEQVEKRDDHLLDSLRYALHSYFGGKDRGRNLGAIERRPV